MKDEIKELTIDILLEELNNWKPQYPMELIHIGQRQMAMILDYITTLQEENKHLNLQLDQALKDYDELQEENETLKELNVCVGCNNNPDYKTRIDKAINKIDYIIDYGFDYDGFDNKEDLKKLIDMLVEYAKESKDILQGYDGFME